MSIERPSPDLHGPMINQPVGTEMQPITNTESGACVHQIGERVDHMSFSEAAKLLAGAGLNELVELLEGDEDYIQGCIVSGCKSFIKLGNNDGEVLLLDSGDGFDSCIRDPQEY